MKHLFPFMMFLLAFTARAYTVLDTGTGLIRESQTIPEPVRTVERLTNGTKVTYEFAEILLEADPLVPNAYYPIIRGFGQIETETQPWLPVRVDRFSVSDLNCAIQILEDQSIIVPLTISPARAEHTEYEEYVYTSDNLPAITKSLTYLPTNIVTDNNGGIYRDVKIKSVTVTPIQYNPTLKQICVHKKFSYLVEDNEIEATDNGNSRVLHGDPIMGALDNYSTEASKVLPIRYATPAPIGYLIITQDNLMDCANQISWWKMRYGYNVTILSEKKWTSEKIKQAVKTYYDKTPHAYYLLIIGDDKLVPTEKFLISWSNGKPNYLYTDLYYACMDGDDDQIPDLCYGRIPASTNAEGMAVHDKMLKYDGFRGKPDNEITRFMGAAYFQDQFLESRYSDGIEDRNYVRTVETICAALESKFDAVDRVYCTGGNVLPCGWKPGELDEPFPEHLNTEAAWQGSADDIIKSFNANCNLILHRDHGEAKGWSNPLFQTEDLANLTNTVYPIVLSMNCNTGNYTEADNFAKTILCQKDGGAVAVVGATAPSYTYRNDIISMAMIKSIWPDLGLKNFYKDQQFKNDFDQPVNSIGEALLVGLTKMDEVYPELEMNLRQRREYHCFGDPSMNIYWNKDNILEDNVNITYQDEVIEISLGGMQSAYIAIWDSTGGHILKRYYGNYVKYETPWPETTIMISKSGYRPVIASAGSHTIASQLTGIASLASIKSASFCGNDELSVIIDNPDVEGLTLTVLESSNLAAGGICTTLDAALVTTYTVNNSSNKFFYITLRKGNEIIDCKSILKR